jgi:hypothetical protein
VTQGVNPEELSSAVRRVLTKHGDGYKPLSFEKAGKHVGISSGTVYSMAQGKPVDVYSVFRFARGFKEDVAYWLKLAGYDDFAEVVSPDAVEPSAGVLDKMLEEVPLPDRGSALEDTVRFIRGWVVPRYKKTAS